MKIALVLVFSINTILCYGQWTKVTDLPTDIMFSLYYNNNTLYAGGIDKIYIGRDHGNTWDSSAIILPSSRSVDAFISFKGWLYIAYWSHGVFRSKDNGKTWENGGIGIYPFVSKLTEWRGNMYASTLGNAVYRLDSTTLNSWTHFSEGISDLSANCNSLAGTNNVLITSGGHNGLYNRLAAFSNEWEEELITGNIRVGMTVVQIISANDSLFLATTLPQHIFRSTDNGTSWQTMGPSTQFNDGVPTSYMAINNSKQAILLARNIFTGGLNSSIFYYKYKNTALPESWIIFDTLPHFTFYIIIAGNRLWAATANGLFYRTVTFLPDVPPVESPRYTFNIGPVYPNPVKQNGHIAITLDQPQPLTARLYDAVGRLVAVIAADKPLNEGTTILTFNMSKFQAGVYFLQLKVKDKVVMRSMVHAN